MESILTDSMVFCKISTFKPNPNSAHRFRNTSHRFNESDIKFLLKPPFFGSPLFLSTPKLKLSISPQIAARFQRPKRRNALRKKLIGEEQEQVRNSNVFHQEFPFKNEENLPTSSNYSGIVSSDVIETDSVGSDVLNLSSDSVRWNELISWASQYKEDNDCWGVGSGSIFTVYQDHNGNVDRVYVNEDEIIRRSGVEPGFLNQEKQTEKIAGANSKILRAKAVAREIEIGSYKVPRNSSIAKFVLIQGKRSSVSNRSLFESVGIQRVLFSKISRVGFVVMCGTVLFWAVKKLFMLKDDSVKLTKVQKKMLQRKIKSRMEKEKMKDSNVEVLPNVSDLTGPIVRPQLNTDELMQIILKAKATDENSSVLDTFSSQLVKNTDFDDKIVEIQEMARAVRKLEQEGPSKFDEDGKTISDSEVGDEELDNTDISETKSQVDNIMMDAEVLMEKQKTETHKEKSLDFRNNLLAEKPDKSLDINEVVENNDHQTVPGDYAIKSLKNEHKNINDPNGPDSSIKHNGNLVFKNGTEETENRELSFHDSSSGSSPPESKKAIKMKPRIIRSVKEAREYLSQRRGFGTEKEIRGKKMDKKLNLSVKNIDGFTNEELNGQASQQILEKNKFEETSKSILSSNTAILMNQYTVRKEGYSFEDSKPPTNSNASSMETNFINRNSGSLDSIVAINGNLVSKDRVETENRELSFHDSSSGSSPPESKKSIKMKPRIIRSVKEAREYLSEKRGFGTEKEIRGKKMDKKLNPSVKNIDGFSNEELNGQASQQIFEKNKFEETSAAIPRSNTAISMNQSTVRKEGYSFEDSKPLTNLNSSSMEKNVINMNSGSLDSIDAVNGTKAKPLPTKESWVETDFEKFHPIVEKIGVGFRENYMVARERIQEESSLGTETSFPGFKEYDEDELEWMKDDGLREIVFQVRENELAGRDPFHLMDAEDKHKFFEGLEKKVEKENVKLLELHEWVHSMVENLDYGVDGISLYDPPEKIIPRWKGPAIDKDPEFLKDYMENRSKIISRKLGISQTPNPAVQNSFQKSKEPSSSDGISTSSPTNLSSLTQRPQLTQHQASTNRKTVIQGSDGSIKAGKKTGKEYWQHTKKWSREFLEMYNAETDPEVKSVMKDMGKDLDKWITDKEIQETADLMTRIPKRKRKSIEKKLDKLKRECEMFGPQAVVSKYREYTDQKEEDYLWWLDLPFVLCIELYTMKDNIEEVGFYSLEMAEDLELDPKQYHVIAFQDTGDSKNFCYIIQAHMEMLGNGIAFVVARPPKEAFREAKANGFNVTVIRKGQLQLNVDQTLEEVESEITEIGNKMYHDKIMRERSIDMGSLMKSVFGRRKSTRRRPKRMLTKSMKKS